MIYRFSILILIVFLSSIVCQDFSTYKQLIDEGKVEEVQKSLPYLSSQYPEHPFVLYLAASVSTNGEDAIKQFKEIIKNHPGSIACELSIMKTGEYLYSRGLYTQASEQLKIIPLDYPDSKNIENAVHLMKKSYLATGEQDSIDKYIDIFSKKYPGLNFNDYNYYSSVILQEEKPTIEEIIIDSVKVIKPEIRIEEVKLGEKPWVVQVGAFGDKKNADIIVERLETAGYTIEVIENQGDIILYLVQIVRFATIEKAINIGERVNDQFGIDFRIIERN